MRIISFGIIVLAVLVAIFYWGFMNPIAFPFYTLAVLIVIWMINKATEDMPFRRNKMDGYPSADAHKSGRNQVVPTPQVSFWQKVNERFARERQDTG